MTYRTPIIVGDRVALAPHTDLWMQGHRIGLVTDRKYLTDQRRYAYCVNLPDTFTYIWLGLDDLLGAVGEPPRPLTPAADSTGTHTDPQRRYDSTLIESNVLGCLRCTGTDSHPESSCPWCNPTAYATFAAKHRSDR